MIHSATGLIHTIAAVVALITGAMVFSSPKAGRRHRTMGYVYSGTMLVLIVTAFSIYRLTGRFNGLHVAAIVSAVTLAGGLWHVVRRKPEGVWFDRHYNLMFWSYVGLFAAFVAETATRVGLPMLQEHGITSFGWFWNLVGIATFVVITLGVVLKKRFEGGLERYRPKSPDKRREHNA